MYQNNLRGVVEAGANGRLRREYSRSKRKRERQRSNQGRRRGPSVHRGIYKSSWQRHGDWGRNVAGVE